MLGTRGGGRKPKVAEQRFEVGKFPVSIKTSPVTFLAQIQMARRPR